MLQLSEDQLVEIDQNNLIHPVTIQQDLQRLKVLDSRLVANINRTQTLFKRCNAFCLHTMFVQSYSSVTHVNFCCRIIYPHPWKLWQRISCDEYFSNGTIRLFNEKANARNFFFYLFPLKMLVFVLMVIGGLRLMIFRSSGDEKVRRVRILANGREHSESRRTIHTF